MTKLKSAKKLLEYKFWPNVSRADNVFGERNPSCDSRKAAKRLMLDRAELPFCFVPAAQPRPTGLERKLIALAVLCEPHWKSHIERRARSDAPYPGNFSSG